MYMFTCIIKKIEFYFQVYIYNLAYICNLYLWITIEWIIFCGYQNYSTNTADWA